MKKSILSISLCLLLLMASMPMAFADDAAGQEANNESGTGYGTEPTDPTHNTEPVDPNNNSENEPVVVPVYKLSVSSSNITFYAGQEASGTMEKNFTVKNEGNVDAFITWTKSQTNDMIAFSVQGAGTVAPGGTVECTVLFNAGNSPNGTYNALLLFSDYNDPNCSSNVQVSVTATVDRSATPSVSAGNSGSGSHGNSDDKPTVEAATPATEVKEEAKATEVIAKQSDGSEVKVTAETKKAEDAVTAAGGIEKFEKETGIGSDALAGACVLEVKVTDGGKEITDLGSIELFLPLNGNFEPGKIYKSAVIDADGTASVITAECVEIDGKLFAKVRTSK